MLHNPKCALHFQNIQAPSIHPTLCYLHLYPLLKGYILEKERSNTALSFLLLISLSFKGVQEAFNLSETVQMDIGIHVFFQYQSCDCIPPGDVRVFASVFLLFSKAPQFDTLESSLSPSFPLSPCLIPKPCDFFLPHLRILRSFTYFLSSLAEIPPLCCWFS